MASHLLPVLASAAILGLQPSTSRPPRDPWPFGVEREVDEGIYATLLSERNGWRFWRFEEAARFLQEDPSDRTGPPPTLVTCLAIRPTDGGAHPTPTGEGRAFSGNGPFLSISWSSMPWYSRRIEGRNPNGQAQVRAPGERYWSSLHEVTLNDGDRIEVHVESWADRSSRTGHIEERGILHLVGLDDADERARSCSLAPSTVSVRP